MPRDEKFYHLNAYGDEVKPGAEICIKHSVSFNEWNADPHISPLVGLSEKELVAMQKASAEQEKAFSPS